MTLSMLNLEILGVFQMLDSKLNLIFHFSILIFEPQMTTLQGHKSPLHPGRLDPARRVAGADEVARLRDGRRHAGARGRRHRGGRLHCEAPLRPGAAKDGEEDLRARRAARSIRLGIRIHVDTFNSLY